MYERIQSLCSQRGPDNFIQQLQQQIKEYLYLPYARVMRVCANNANLSFCMEPEEMIIYLLN